MGVHGLWELLAPVGRRVSVETLAGKKLAIDASIWMVQFMKAMRDEKGDMVRNAHILGFFRRICKLLFLRTKPVFVFDGATPALKRCTVIARRRQRENAQAKIRKTAEKLLLNHLKATRLKELANDLENQRQKNDAKGKKVIIDQEELAGNNGEGNNTLSFSCNQEALDEILAASLAAEADDSCTGNASTSRVEIPFEEEDDDDDEEMIFPPMAGKVDPSVLAALPPSMQLDLLVQMRERLMAENRQKYQKVKKVPAKFSELQIQAYLKTVAFRREIDEVQKSAAGKGVGGVQSTRIASEANREFIFSTSFTGDKQIITSAGVERHSEKQGQSRTQLQPPTSEPAESIASTKKSNPETVSVADDTGRVFDDEIETYMDERGHLRVSRVRAMGIRMTRDLQRNLDLMKEIEHDAGYTKDIVNSNYVLSKNAAGISKNIPDKIQLKKASYQFIDGSVQLGDRNDQSTPNNSNSMEISFEDDGGHECLDVDDIFADLVTGDPVMNSKDDVSPLKNHSCDSDSNFDWEEGLIEKKGDSLLLDVEKETSLPFAEGHNNDESEVEWEDGDCAVFKNVSTSLAGPSKNSSKGALEEDADFQEAIRRSLEDIMKQKSSDASFEDEKLREVRKMAHEITRIQENDRLLPNLPQENALQLDKQSYEVASGIGRSDGEAGMDMLGTGDSPEKHLATSKVINTDCMEGLLDKPFESYLKFHDEHLLRDTIKGGDLLGQIGNEKSIPPVAEKGVHLAVEEFKSNVGGQISTSATQSVVTTEIFEMVLGETPHIIAADAPVNVLEAAPHNLIVEPSQEGESFVNELNIKHDVVQKLSKENIAELKGDEEFTLKDDIMKPMDFTEASLEDEMTNLSRERVDLADKQRKLERNAESVSSEMFTECQELLQMFGLPYIIAPMEAEAQCAYLELSNLVDGVVTDDSDVFLFGAQNVYKNIFDNRKYVETYFMKDIENELGLTRDQLIHMALLLGSDYTEGVSGIGIVNAIEVVNAFPEEDGLTKFREWIESPDPTILGKFDVQKGSNSGNRGTKVCENNVNFSNINMEGGLSAREEIVPQSTEDCIQNTKQLFMDKHRNVSKNWHIPSTFPNVAVISAYVCPQVDKSTEPFTWGKPDLFVLRKLCWEKFGWNIHKADELLLPVLKEYNKHETQLRLEAFYTFNERFARIRSKRIKKAVKGITGNTSISESRDDKSDNINSTHKSTANMSRKRKNKEPEPSGGRNFDPFMQTEGGKITKKRLSAGGRGRGSNGRGSRERSCDLGDGENKEKQEEKLGRPRELRKSTRTRKPVKYASDDDSELDEPGKASQDEQNCTIEKETHHKLGDDRSVEEHSAGADCEMVGGFCLDEAEEPELETGDDPCVVESSKEYLNTGGGFCLDEDDDAKEDNFERASERANFMEEANAERSNTDELYDEQNLEHSTPRASDDNISLSSRVQKDDSGILPPVKSLSAMPYLRRKRKKS